MFKEIELYMREEDEKKNGLAIGKRLIETIDGKWNPSTRRGGINILTEYGEIISFAQHKGNTYVMMAGRNEVELDDEFLNFLNSHFGEIMIRNNDMKLIHKNGVTTIEPQEYGECDFSIEVYEESNETNKYFITPATLRDIIKYVKYAHLK